jgi:tRNA A37 methylthiotransferase MiaB
VELAKWAGFSKIHVFPFSVRAGTAAAKLKGRLPADVIKQRAQILRKVSDELGRKFVEQFVGQTCNVLLEDTEPLSGRSERYFMVYLDPLLLSQSKNHSGAGGQIRKSDCRFNKNEIVKVRITEATEEGATGIEDR